MTGSEIFWSLLMLAFWIGFWLWFFTRNDLLPDAERRRSPLTGNGGGISLEKDENQNLADWAQ